MSRQRREYGNVVRYLAVTAAFVIAVGIAHAASVKATHAANEAKAAATEADAIAKATRRNDRAIIAVRNAQVAQLHASAVASCASRHKLTVVLNRTIRRSILLARQTETGPLSRIPGLKAAQEQGVKIDRDLLHDLRGADCRGVPQLPKTPKKASGG